jgi:glutathione reductase (NADPH)
LSLDFRAAGIAVDARGAIVVDNDYRTNIGHIYAIGDVTARLQLTPVALAEATIVARRLFGAGAPALDYGSIPTAIFSTPNFSSVGPTETEARHQFGAIDVYVKNFSPLQHMLSGSVERVFMKLIVERGGQRVVGAQMVGPDAAEIIQGLAIAIRSGATKDEVDCTVGIHPTAAEEFVSMRVAR